MASPRSTSFGPANSAGQKKGGQPKRTAQGEDTMLTLTEDQREASVNSSDPGLSTRWESTLVKTLVRQGFVRWTSKEAALVLGETAFPGQTRHLKSAGQEHIKVLAEMMRRDLWRPFDKLDFSRLPDGRLILVNGHHRLSAQELAQRTIEWAVVIHDRGTMEEVSQLYHDFDTNVRLRTQDQIIDASGLDDELGLSKKIATAVFTAVPLIATGLDPSKASRDLLTERIYGLRYSLVKEYRDAAKALELALKSCRRSAPAATPAARIGCGRARHVPASTEAG
jgi:hypothetical protein